MKVIPYNRIRWKKAHREIIALECVRRRPKQLEEKYGFRRIKLEKQQVRKTSKSLPDLAGTPEGI